MKIQSALTIGNLLLKVKSVFFKDKKVSYQRLISLLLVTTVLYWMVYHGGVLPEQIESLLELALQFFEASEEVI